MGVFGQALGGLAGQLGSQILPIPGVDGKSFGSFLGGLLPFKKGGVVPAYARGGVIVPVPVPIRKYQKGGKVKKSKSRKSRK